jgi:hypothetical protein
MMSKLDQKLQQLYQQSKTEHPMPESLKQQLSQLTSKPNARRWTTYWPAVQGVAASAALIWLAQQLWWQPAYYQIQLQTDNSYHQVQLHSLSDTEAPPQQSAYQQRYRHYQQARQQLEQTNSLIGQLHFHDHQWQIAVCDQLLVKIDQQLAQELQQDQPWLEGQWVELKTGQQGQILAVHSQQQALQCDG